MNKEKDKKSGILAKLGSKESKGSHVTRSIKIKMIAVFGLIILLGSIAMGWIGANRGSRILRNEVERNLLTLAEEGSRLTSAEMRGEQETLITLSQSALMEDMIWENQKNVIMQVLGDSDYIDMSVANLKGEVMSVKEGKFKYEDGSTIDRTLKTGEVASDFVLNPGNNNFELIYSVPIKKGGSVVGALVGSRTGDHLSELVAETTIGEEGFAYILDGNGVIIGHPEYSFVESNMNTIESAKENNLKDTEETFTRIVNEDSGLAEYDFEGDVVSGFKKIEGTDWTYLTLIAESEFMAPMKTLERTLGIVGIINIVVATIATLIVSAGIANPLIEIANISTKIADLDISEDIPEELVKRNDEIGLLSKNYQSTIENLRGFVEDLYESVDYLATTSEELMASSEESASVAEEVTRTVTELARGAEEQALNTQDGSVQADGLGNALDNNQSLLRELNKYAEEVTGIISEGMTEIQDLSNIAEESSESVREIRRVILQSSESANEIGKASNVIASIADQTNLLALNAAIEAARAGEAGRGFAVVAEEIRVLAEQSAESTMEINRVVAEIQAITDESVEAVGKVIEISNEQLEGVEKNRSHYETIDGSINETKTAIDQLNDSEIEMQKGRNVIVDSLQNLTAIAEENSAATEEVSAAMQEQSASTEEIANASEYLADLAETINEKVRNFKI